jgi:hypothetical protein
MSSDTDRNVTQESSLVRLDREDEVCYWIERFHVSREELAEAVEAASPRWDAVERRLNGA